MVCGIIVEMEPESIPEKVNSGDSGILKSFVIYLVIFGFGFVAATFSGGFKDSVKGTANLATNTAKETFAISGGGTGEFVPLKSGTVKNSVAKKPIVYKAKPSLPVVVSEQEGIGAGVAVTSTINKDLVATSSNILAPVSSSSVVANPVVVSATSSNNLLATPSGSNQVAEMKFSPLIYEIRIAGEKASEDYIKIFNPNPETVDLSGWKLRKRTQRGIESSSVKVFPNGTSVGAGKVLTWANSSYASIIGAELSNDSSIAANNSVGLLNKDGVLVDAVGWGEVSGEFVEGSAYPTNPEEGQVLLRKQSGGLLVDTQNNSADFEIY